jgi:outer membrane protein OmpA-like peptidoglycan-associated protein
MRDNPAGLPPRTRGRRRAGLLGRFLLLALAGLLLAAVPAAAGIDEEQSNHNAAFLRVGVDARHLAMGGAGAALAEGVAAGYWNPAGLAILRGVSLTGMTAQKLNFDRRHNYAAGAWGGERFALGVSWINAGTDAIPRTDAAGLVLEEFAFVENAILVSGAAQAGKARVGLSAKLITQDLGTTAPEGGDDTALGFGLDVGGQIFITQFARAGLVIQDLFAKVGDQDRENVNDIPANLRAGLALEPMDGFVLTSDIEKTRDDGNLRFHAGGELEVPLSAGLTGAVRMGVQEGNLSGGFGAALGAFTLDYAYVIESEAFLDENHRVSVTVDFGSKRELFREGGHADADFDGFPDDEDGCPDEPEDFDGFNDFDGCPDDDNDNDGIPDFDDQCPDEPEDFDGFQDADGCPDPDNDGDGIPDDKDACPDEPETKNGFEDDDGCPDAAALTFPPVHITFASGSAVLPAAGAEAALSGVVDALREHPGLRLEIRGHTDDRGDPGRNQRLSERRARAVKDYLVSRGIDAGRLEVRGLGSAEPAASNDTEAGRAMNRRITFEPVP